MRKTWRLPQLILLGFCLLLPQLALAATYSFGEGWFSVYNPPPCQGGSWSYNGASTYTCSGRMVLAAGDTVIVSTAIFEPLGNITLVANGGFTLAGNTIGTSGKNISLRTDFSTLTGTGTNNIYGSVRGGSDSVALAGGTITGALESSSGSITLNGTTVNGTLTSNGANNLTNATIGGTAQINNTLVASATRFNSALTVSSTAQLTGGTVVGAAQVSGALGASGTTFSSNVTGSSTATLNGGSVAGFLNVAGDVTTTNGTTIGGAITSSYGLVSLSGGSVGGKITGPNGVTSNNTNISGDVVASNGAISLSAGTIIGNITDGCCQVTLTGVTLTGNVSTTSNNLVISGSSITGNLTSTNVISLANTSVTGNVTAASWSTITGTGTSKVVGTCTPSLTSPADLCQAVVGPTCVTDNFNRSSLGSSDWTVTNRNGSFGDPRIVGNRLRLTDNSGNVATASTFQRLLPATGNYVQVQFKYYAYNGDGADGVAVIFSDASITPQPGGYGGSLGYAQLNGASGFAGGWLGVALDEFGNFSNPTETRNGGPGQRADSVSIRGSGSGTSGYRYLAGTAANLNPGIDVSGSTAGPGHTYRITLDSTVSGKTMVTVERNTGAGFATLVPSFDALAQSGQTGLPSNFFMSLTGSTGGSNNIHELDDFKICATRMNPVGLQIDHVRIEHDGSALTCQPETVTVKACMDATCSSTYPDPVTVTLTPSAGWVGGNSLALTGGVGTGQYRRTTAGDVIFGVAGVSATLKPYGSPHQCANGGALSTCPLSFYDSGFIFDVPNMVANTERTVSLQAVRTSDTSQLCVPAFESGTRTVKFWSTYNNPNSGTRSVAVEGSNIAAALPGTDINLTFGPQARASFKVRYPDAGQMTLNARYAPTSGDETDLVMTGSDAFIARPAGLCVYSDTANSDCTTGDASCSKFVVAGDPFRLRVGGVAWQADAGADLCSGNLNTPNYRQVGVAPATAIALSHALVAPSGGSTGNLGVTGLDIAAADTGEKILTTQSISEVGVFTVTATPPGSYLSGPGVGDSDGDGDVDIVSVSANIGRFYPASFLLADPLLTPACNGSTYGGLSAQAGPPAQGVKAGQTFAFMGSLSARNRGGALTRNYTGSFVKLSAGGISYTDSGNVGVISVVGSGLTEPGAAGVGNLDYSASSPSFLFGAPREPYPLAILTRATDSDGVTGSIVDVGNPIPGTLPDFRLGQARINNAHGSELQDLSLPFTASYFNGSGYAPNLLDNCTVFTPASLGAYQRTDTGVGTPVLASGAYQVAAGAGGYLLRAPGQRSSGSVLLTYDGAPAWLQYDWNGDGVLDKPTGLATFGIYKGAAPLIFRRELYR